MGYRDILGAPNAAELLAEYSAECALPELGEAAPQAHLYEAMERSGAMQAFGVFEGRALIGFATVLIYTVPHYGKWASATESIFIAREKRSAGAAGLLLDTIDGYAKGRGCEASFYSAPVGSRFARFLHLHSDRYRNTNSVFLRKL